MAGRLKAIGMLRPRVKLNRMIEMDQIVAFVQNRSGLSRAGISQVLAELNDAILFFGRDGRTIKLEGLARFTPNVSLDGTLSFSVTVDSELQSQMNNIVAYKGDFYNRQNLGKTPDELLAQWNEQNPGDPVL
jgi:hypothetical protein